MSREYIIECPECNKMINIIECIGDGTYDGNVDFKCPVCKKYFVVRIEYKPVCRPIKIEYKTCKCGKRKRSINMFEIEGEYLCRECYYEIDQ